MGKLNAPQGQLGLQLVKVSSDLAELAHRYAAKTGWRFLSIVEIPGLFGLMPVARFAGPKGRQYDRSLDDLRLDLGVTLVE